jgi:hypothetical protein
MGNEMAAAKGSDIRENPPDLTHLIRSLQRIEGNPDCFRTAAGQCDRMDCAWRIYCLDEGPDHAP